MSDNYVYLAIAIPFFVLSVAIFIYRKDLSRLVIKAGLAGGAVGVLSEYWYFSDYWIPPTVFESALLPVEDFLFGFGVTVVGATIYKVIHGLYSKKTHPDRRRETLLYFGAAFVALITLTNLLSVNSIVVSSVLFTLVAASMLYVRRDLCKQAVTTSMLLVGFAITIYIPLFNLFAGTYIANYFLLSDSSINPSLLGVMPLSEIIWYFSWGLLAGTIFDYARGTSPETTNVNPVNK